MQRPPGYDQSMARVRARMIMKQVPSRNHPVWLMLLDGLNFTDRRDIASGLAVFFARFKSMNRSSSFRELIMKFGSRGVKQFYNGIRGVPRLNTLAVMSLTPPVVDQLTEIVAIYGYLHTGPGGLGRAYAASPLARKLGDRFFSTVPGVVQRAELYRRLPKQSAPVFMRRPTR